MSENRAKFGYLLYDDILQKIDEKIINAYDFVFGKDTREYYIISEDLKPISVKSRISVFNSVEEAKATLNTSLDTHVGQLVAILDNGIYRGYIVNKVNDSYTVTALYEDPNQINYNELGNIPITNLVGTLDNMVIVDKLATGTYKVQGQYKVSIGSETIYLSVDGDFIIVDSQSDKVLIKRITSDTITDFKVENGNISTSFYITDKYLKDNGYTTNEYVDSKTLALEESIKNYIHEYVENIIVDKVDTIIDKRLDEKLDEKLNELINEIPNEEVANLF